MVRNRRGFTIIELLIVMAVIAILIGIALPRFKGMRDEGNYTKAMSELRSLQAAVESYRIHEGEYPPSTTTLCESYLNNASPAIIDQILTDPFHTNAEYRYARSRNGEYYVIYSYGVDGARDITGINNSGVLRGRNDDDIYVTNGSGF